MFFLIFWVAGIKIKRGYKERSKENETEEITTQNEEIHLIFVSEFTLKKIKSLNRFKILNLIQVVHGIAQKLYEKFGDDFTEAKIYRIRFTDLLDWILSLPHFEEKGLVNDLDKEALLKCSLLASEIFV